MINTTCKNYDQYNTTINTILPLCLLKIPGQNLIAQQLPRPGRKACKNLLPFQEAFYFYYQMLIRRSTLAGTSWPTNEIATTSLRILSKMQITTWLQFDNLIVALKFQCRMCKIFTIAGSLQISYATIHPHFTFKGIMNHAIHITIIT